MNGDGNGSGQSHGPSAGPDSELERVLDAYLAEVEAGRAPDPERFLAEHPGIAGALRACLDVLRLADDLAEGPASGPSARRTDDGTDAAGRPPGSGTLTELWALDEPPPRVLLADPPGPEGPPLRALGAAGTRPDAVGPGRYQIVGEIGRGGMGAVLQGRDADLGRDLAIKVLLESRSDDPDATRRFVEEAQIGGQLQHPGIVPVYELGAFAGGRPYFAMKLVRGRTLAALLRERPDPSADLPRFLSIFEQVAQTVAYAHARGVIHRDLKPSNVMVGSFGEVQVVDWGLAKVLPRRDEPSPEPATEPIDAPVRTIRSGPDSEASRAGSVLGTPAYMAPEQARGEVEALDARSDVFGLGAILCEVLTGEPPFVGGTGREVLERARRGDTAESVARLDACGADAGLIVLARDCLAPEPAGRPRDAGVVAARTTAYLAGVQERLQASELERARANVRAAEERKRRHLTVALASAVVLLFGLGGLGALAYQRQAAEEGGRVATASARAAQVLESARLAWAARLDPSGYEPAVQAADAAVAQVTSRLSIGLRRRTLELAEATRSEAEAAVSDRALLDEADSLRTAALEAGFAATDRALARAFGRAGLDFDADMDRSVARLSSRPRPVATAIAVRLDDWAALRRRLGQEPGRYARLLRAARAADPTPYRDRLRSLLEAGDLKSRRDELARIAGAADAGSLTALDATLLASGLHEAGDTEAAVGVLRRAVISHPGDLRINFNLATLLGMLGPSHRDEAIRYYTAARAIRPESAHELGHQLDHAGRAGEAEAIFLDLASRQPRDVSHLICYADLDSVGPDATSRAISRAVGAAREAVARSPRDPLSHLGLGKALEAAGDPRGAVGAYREAIRLEPDNQKAHRGLGSSLRRAGDLPGAIASCREAIRLMPDDASASIELAKALRDSRDLPAAAAAYRQAIRLSPTSIDAYNSFGIVLRESGDLPGAIGAYRQALKIKPRSWQVRINLGDVLRALGDLPGAVREFREAVRLGPEHAEPHYYLGRALSQSGDLKGGIAALREAIRLKPDDADAHTNLAIALQQNGDIEGAIAEQRATIRLRPDSQVGHSNLGIALLGKGDLAGAEAECREAIRLSPAAAPPHVVLGDVLRARGDHEGAVAEYRTAIGLRPGYATAHHNLGNALRRSGDLDGAIHEYREAIRLEPTLALPYSNLSWPLREQGRLDESEAACRQALRLQPDLADAHCNLGHTLLARGRFAEALTEMRRGHELGSRQPGWRAPSAEWVAQAERLVALERRLSAVLRGEDRPRDATERLILADVAYKTSRYADAARLFAGALQSDPNLVEDRVAQHAYNAACCAALAGCGKGHDDPPPDAAARAGLRAQALAWLRADLATWSKQSNASGMVRMSPQQLAESGSVGQAAVARALAHWRSDPDLSGVRDPEALAKLPTDETLVWRALWRDVEALRRRAASGAPVPPARELPADPFARGR